MPQIVTSWHVLQLPSGFKLTVQRVQILAGSVAPVQHMVFSDGLASVSVFIEPLPSDDQMRGLARVGSAYAFSRPVNGHQVTAVGEVPAATVEAIAESVSQDEVKTVPGAALPTETHH
jgi:sigma-E factor negative regulatory protein RseB